MVLYNNRGLDQVHLHVSRETWKPETSRHRARWKVLFPNLNIVGTYTYKFHFVRWGDTILSEECLSSLSLASWWLLCYFLINLAYFVVVPPFLMAKILKNLIFETNRGVCYLIANRSEMLLHVNYSFVFIYFLSYAQVVVRND